MSGITESDKRMHRVSLSSILLIIWVSISIYIAVVIFAFSGTLVNYDRQQDKAMLQKTADRYADVLDQELRGIKSSVNMIYADDVALKRLSDGRLSDFEKQGSLYVLQNNFSARVKSSGYMWAMFYYDRDSDRMRFAWNDYPFSGSVNLLMKETKGYVRSHMDNTRSEGYFLYEDEDYYCYLFRKGSGYVGAILNLSRYFDNTAEYPVCITVDEAELPEKENEGKNRGIEVSSSLSNEMVTVHLMESGKSVFGLMRDSRLLILAVIYPIILGGFCLALMKGLRKLMFTPVEQLHRKITEMCSGTKTEGYQPSRIREFSEINAQIDSLIDEVDLLQKERYQEKMRADHAQLQYYELQVNPHFFLNCLNTVDSLMDSGNEMVAKDLIKALSEHFRYVFRSRRSLVSVREELKEVQDYCRIYSLKGGFPIILQVDSTEEADEMKVPVLTIQTFVENSIKYSGKIDELLRIIVKCWTENRKKKKKLRIHIEDNGQGYAEEMLQKLNKKVTEEEYRGGHVGIDNIRSRVFLIFGDRASFIFSNQPLGGAVTDIEIGEMSHEHHDP